MKSPAFTQPSSQREKPTGTRSSSTTVHCCLKTLTFSCFFFLPNFYTKTIRKRRLSKMLSIIGTFENGGL